MAERKPPAAAIDATPPVTDAAPEREIPSFTKVAEESRDARSAELAELAGVTAPKPAEAPPGDGYDFDTEYAKLPERFRSDMDQRYFSNYNDALGREYGDVMPLAIEMTKNPNLRATFAAAASDPELREFLADPTAREQIKDLSNKQLRDFLFGEAKSTYQKYSSSGATPGAAAADPRDARLERLEQTLADERGGREMQTHIANRQREVAAVVSEFPDLGQPENRGRLQHVINFAEERFENAALRAGVKIMSADGKTPRPSWVSEALAAGIKPMPYREAHQYYAEVLGRSAPPSAPATSPATAPAPAQAPRSASEGKQRALEVLKRGGGLKGLATASRRR